VASALNEISFTSGKGISIEEELIPVTPEVRAACEIMGFDPLYIANEGKLLFFVPPGTANEVLQILRSHPLGVNAAIIGKVTSENAGVRMKTAFGSTRIVDMITGEQLPRIC
jgi:hydrogenase expression/formation protein HypE